MNSGKFVSQEDQHGLVGKSSFFKKLGYLSLVPLIGLASLSITGCGSDEADKSASDIEYSKNDGRNAESSSDPTTQQGQFVDSAVSGLFYRTDSVEGFTNHNGYFSYQADESISFSIGNINLGSAQASELLTPIELGQSQDSQLNDTSINILRLLQTLDDDGDPSNGIAISENTHLAAMQLNGTDIDVTVSVNGFEQNTALMKFLGQVTNVSELVSQDSAIAHFQTTQAQMQNSAR